VRKINILWADDEIDHLKPHILFLEEKGYQITTANNGDDAIDLVSSKTFDIIFLDENMPGLSGLETLAKIKASYPLIPVIMITKSEAEDIMDEAIGSKIADYLIKPVNPKQILLCIKKNVDLKRLVSEKTTTAYQSAFSKIGLAINDSLSFDDWVEINKKLVYWELELDRLNDNTMEEVLKMQKSEANNSFSRFIKKNYFNWFSQDFPERPFLSVDVIKQKVLPGIQKKEKVFMILIDNLRFDQWKILQPVINEFFEVLEEKLFCSILPTATQYSRNSMFAGLMPLEIEKLYPQYWKKDEEEGGKNLFEEELLKQQFSRIGQNVKFHFEKISNNKSGKRLVENLSDILTNDLSVIIYNFVDMLSHSRTEMQMIRELAEDEAAYRSLTLSWFEHSPLLDLIKKLSEHEIKIVLTTDHGTIRVNNPLKVIGDKNTSSNLRYKQGRNLNYNPKEVFEIRKPEQAHLPKSNMSSSYIFATKDDFFVYPNNYNHFVKYYKNTFQHGGISMEEMIIPLISLAPKR